MRYTASVLSLSRLLPLLFLAAALFAAPIHDAARDGDLARLRDLAKDPAVINLQDSSGDTPLHHAARNGRADAVKLLLELGGNPASFNLRGENALDLAIAGHHSSCIKLLFAAKTGPAPALPAGSQPVQWTLITAVSRGKLEIVDMLLKLNANVAATDKEGKTALHWAAVKGYSAIAQRLLDRQANVNARDLQGITPLHDAALGGHREIAELLLAKGAGINARESESQTTPLWIAASWGRDSIVELLLAKGADSSIPSSSGKTPLDAARDNNFTAIVQLLSRPSR